jgi:hypothetical protein
LRSYLAKGDKDWRAVILTPKGKKGVGYGIA